MMTEFINLSIYKFLGKLSLLVNPVNYKQKKTTYFGLYDNMIMVLEPH